MAALEEMEGELVALWRSRFGADPPDWARNVDLQNVDGQVEKCRQRVEALKRQLEKELFLLEWLEGVRCRKRGEATETHQEALPLSTTVPPTREGTLAFVVGRPSPSPTKRIRLTHSDSSLGSPGHLERKRQVDSSDELLAKRLSNRRQAFKSWSVSGFDTVLKQENSSPGGERQAPEGRRRSLSDSAVPPESQNAKKASQAIMSDKERTLSPIPDVVLPVSTASTNSPSDSTSPCESPFSRGEVSPCSSPAALSPGRLSGGEEDRRNSNSTILHESESGDDYDEDDELLASVDTVVPQRRDSDTAILDAYENSGIGRGKRRTLVRKNDRRSGSIEEGDKTPTDSLSEVPPEEPDILEQGITSMLASRARLGSDALQISEAGRVINQEAALLQDDDNDDSQSADDSMGEGERGETNSVNDLEMSGDHSSYGGHHSFSDLAEATITYILRDTIFAGSNNSRSNSVSSLPGRDGSSASPDSYSSKHGVNLRPNSHRRRSHKRSARVMENAFSEEDLQDEEKLAQMLQEIQDNSSFSSHSPRSPSPSSEFSSNPASPTHSSDFFCDTSLSMPSSARASRICQVRRSAVVVHGEVMVIRKLVVAGIVTAERSYLDCLLVMKEYYRKPLLALSTTSQPIVSERDVNTIFYRVEDLFALHTSLHDKLDQQLQNWGVHSCVADFFLELCKNLKLYKDTVEMYRRSLECLESRKTDPNFKRFLEDVRLTVTSQYKDVPNVNDLLRRPVERLQSYSLVLNDLCQHTPKDHPDFSVLKQSLTVMADFIASTHDPRAFSELSGGFNRELVKQELTVELSDGGRKIRRLFLFHDILVSAKEKGTRHGNGIKLEPKWYLPLVNLRFHPAEVEALQPVPVTSDQELSVIKSRLAALKVSISKDTKEKDRGSRTMDKDASTFKRGLKAHIIGSKTEKLRRKYQEQQITYWVASPSLPLRLYGTNGKKYVFLLHNEDERESWLSAIKKLQPKAVGNVNLSQVELQDLLTRQKVHLTIDQKEVIDVQTDEDEYLTGILRVRVTSATNLKVKQGVGLMCALEVDEYGRFDRKARTLPAMSDTATLITNWDQDFELEVVGAHIIKVIIYSKSLLKEEVHTSGKFRIPVIELKSNKRQKMEVNLYPAGHITIVLEYFSSLASMGKRPGLLSSGVFGVGLDVVSKREHHEIPLILQTCVDEVERRGLSEVGIYRVAGVLRDIQELRKAFDTDYLQAQLLAAESDIHAVAGLLKRYFRELPDPLFTDELYVSFVQALALSDPEARMQSLVTLFHSLPAANFKTAVYLFKHLRNVASHSDENKMTLQNLATVFGPNLLRPGGPRGAPGTIDVSAMDVVSPVKILIFFMECPEEIYQEPQAGNGNSSAEQRNARNSRRPCVQEDEEPTSPGATSV